jgi:CHAT domain-containing protein
MNTLVRLLVGPSFIGAVVCLASGQAAARLEQPREGIRLSLERGAYAEAERDARQLSATVAAQYGPDSLELASASDLLVEALVRNGKAGASSTLVLAERVGTMKRQQVGDDALETAVSLHNLASVLVERGEFAAALPFGERTLSIRGRYLPSGAHALADTLDLLALALMQMERFDEARHLLNLAQTSREVTADSQPLALARTLELLAWLSRYSGNSRAGQVPLERALALRQKHSPEHPDTASTIQLQGDLLVLAGDIQGARKAWLGGLALVERTLGPDHPAIVGFHRRLALASDALGDRTETRRLLARGLEVGEGALARCNPEFMGLRAYTASSLAYDGNYADARQLYQRLLPTFETCLGPEHSRTTTIVYNLALSASEVGDFAEAERLHEKAILIWSRRLGATHRYVARGWDALAEVAATRGQTGRAQVLYRRALEIRRNALSATHPDIAWTLTNLARVTASSGGLLAAERYVTQAIEIYGRAGASDEPDHFARVLALRGELETRRGQYPSARASFAEALSARERIFGGSHPLAAEARAQLAAADFVLGFYNVAVTGALDAEHAGREHLQFTVRYLPERQAMAYAAKRPRALDLALSAAASGQTSAQTTIFDAVIQSRGVILDELAARARAVGAAPQAASLNASAVQARQRFANLVVKSLREPVPRELLEEARQRKEDAETSLAESSAEARAEMRRAQVGLKDVQAALPRGSALLSFVIYDRTKTLPTGLRPSSTRPLRSYGVFVHRATASEVTFVPLGTAAWIDGQIKSWRSEASGDSMASAASAEEAATTYRTAGLALRRSVWDPLRAHLEGAERIFIVPDGLLNIVNFAALPGGHGRYLIEGRSVIHYLSTERDLVALADHTPRRGLLAVGGPAFGGRPATAAASTSALGSGCEGLGDDRFLDLPGSRREVIEISKFWSAQGPGDVTVLSGAAATETAVKQNVSGSRVVHFATHGFFLGADCTPGIAGTRSVGGLAKRASATQGSTVAANPLLLSGLAFAGANRRGSIRGDQDDGILTAEEIGGLNLQGTEWAVLSACDTGLGEIKAGEGVFGLRRAFQVAGARTVIMSLWSVEDRSAMEWMRSLYEGHFRQGLNTADAVREASLTVLRKRRARGQSVHPFYWAGFVASGDWR